MPPLRLRLALAPALPSAVPDSLRLGLQAKSIKQALRNKRYAELRAENEDLKKVGSRLHSKPCRPLFSLSGSRPCSPRRQPNLERESGTSVETVQRERRGTASQAASRAVRKAVGKLFLQEMLSSRRET